MKKSEEVIAKDSKYFAQAGRIPYYPLVVDEAHGSIIKDIDGKEYIDLLTSASALNVGHTPEKVVQAIKDQTDKFIHYTPAYMHHQPVADLAERLAEISPGNFEKQVSFGLSGSDANDALIKFARGYTGRDLIITFENAYHGSTYGSISMSSISLNMRRKIGPLVPGFHHVPFPDNYRGMYGQTEPNTVEEYLAPLKQMLETYVPADNVAAIVIETLQGDGGLLEPIPGYFEALYELCQEHEILFCVDDVQQGLGRTGTWSSVEHFDVEADLIVYGKSLAGGLPLSALVGRKEIMESLDAPAHLFTTAANPVACQASLAVLDMIEEEDLLTASTEKGSYARNRMAEWEEKFEFVGNTRGIGLSIGVDIVKDKVSKEKDADAALKITNRCFEKGVLMISFAGSVLRFQPPLVITYDELDRALDILEESMEELQAGKLDGYDVSGQGW